MVLTPNITVVVIYVADHANQIIWFKTVFNVFIAFLNEVCLIGTSVCDGYKSAEWICAHFWGCA